MRKKKRKLFDKKKYSQPSEWDHPKQIDLVWRYATTAYICIHVVYTIFDICRYYTRLLVTSTTTDRTILFALHATVYILRISDCP